MVIDNFIKLNNRKNFLISKVPKLHPQSLGYTKYWKRHKKRVIEGFWSQDNVDIEVNVDEDLANEVKDLKSNWRFMPGNLYFYVNFGIILHRPEDAPKSSPKKKIRPILRDIDWELFYNLLEARGFSGFTDDDKYTCNIDLVNKHFKGTFDPSCFNSKGELKEYINPREYLRQLHDRPLGIPLYQNMAKDFFWLACRGVGKSFSIGIGAILHEVITDGAKEYTEASRLDPAKVEIFVGAALSSKSADLLAKTRQGMENLPGDWEEGDVYTPSPLSKTMSGGLGPNNMKKPWANLYDKKIGGTWKTVGSGSSIRHGIYTTENPEAAAGGRYSIAVVEEWGLLGNSLQVHGSNTATMMDYPWKFGTGIWIGTGGNVEKIQEGEVMFRNPRGFEALAFPDLWEGTGEIGWFVPAYYGMNDFKDENGNTNVLAAMEFIDARREEKRKSKDSSALALEMMNYPIKPSEMFLNAKGAMFPQAELKAHLAHITGHPQTFENAHYHGELVWGTEGELQWETHSANKLERQYPIENNKDRPGVIEIIEMPKKDAYGNVITNRYLQGTDTYDDDESKTTSLGSTFILDSWTDRIVAEYTGRRSTKEFYEITRKLSIFYKSIHNYEQNKKGLYTYYDQKNSTHLLCDTPESLKDVADISISKVGNKRKGTNASKPINAYGLRLILDWLLTTAYGEDEDSEKMNLHTIQNEGLLRELMNYNANGNFDRVSALIMLMILKEERIKYIERKQKEKIDTLLEDDFFKRNFDNKFNSNIW
jgi:hypothetical protein